MTNDSNLIPVEFFVVVALDPLEEKTKGGILLPTQTQDKDKLSCQEGTLIAVSPHAFTYADGWPEGTVPQVGQRVLFKRYAGALHERTIGGVKRDFRLLNDKDIIAIVQDEAADRGSKVETWQPKSDGAAVQPNGGMSFGTNDWANHVG